jgi:hypothetical protein
VSQQVSVVDDYDAAAGDRVAGFFSEWRFARRQIRDSRVYSRSSATGSHAMPRELRPARYPAAAT